eukprot:TRINITY_DN8285_c0_g1_i3.p1 TRINITY_DN8285_c0_g1~~TRINITY_DN8285_c0_g1_i3.p1  ORF type:complete len:136 (-),score=41.80 TRINITY_DN8285_c0_g1_i3:145-552(-)
MTSTGYTIYSWGPHNPNVFKSIIAGHFGGIEIAYKHSAPDFEFGKTNKTPEVLKSNPTGKVPYLVGPEGIVFESTAIARYISAKGKAADQLLGKTPIQQAHINQWIDFAASYLPGGIGFEHFGRLVGLAEFEIGS